MPFDYRYLGRTGIRVSPLCLGCMNFGGATGPDDSHAMIDRAIDAGINFVDTANVYSTGRSEEVTGEALKRNRRRDFIVLATKCHGNMHKEGSGTDPLNARLNPNRWGNSRRQIIEQCDASLKRLRTDWIDLYQIHRPHADCAIDETLRALDDLVRSGKVRYIGCSTFAAWQVVESLWVADRHGLNRFVTEQPPYHLLDRRIERELVPMAQTYGLGLIPWSPLAGGFLTGKYKPWARRRRRAPACRRFRRRRGSRGCCVRAFDARNASSQSRGKGLPASAASPWRGTCISRASPARFRPAHAEQLEDNLKALDVIVTDEDRKASWTRSARRAG